MNGIVMFRQGGTCLVVPRPEVRLVRLGGDGDIRITLASTLTLGVEIDPDDDDAIAKNMINDLTDPSICWELGPEESRLRGILTVPILITWRHDGTAWRRTEGPA